MVWPLEDGGVGGGGVGVVVLAGDVEGEVEEGLAARFDKGGETIPVSFPIIQIVRGLVFQRTRYCPPSLPHPTLDPNPISHPNTGEGNPRSSGTGSPTSPHLSGRAIHLSKKEASVNQQSSCNAVKPEMEGDILVGDTEGSLLGTNTHASLGTTSEK